MRATLPLGMVMGLIIPEFSLGGLPLGKRGQLDLFSGHQEHSAGSVNIYVQMTFPSEALS